MVARRAPSMCRLVRASRPPEFIALLLLAVSPFARSQPASHSAPDPVRPVFVELFTSEGCSSCPPADRLLTQLDRKQPVPGVRIVVLSEHVDYWNSLGWRDPFSSRAWSERQEEYGRQFGLASVYTPQIVVDGTRQVVGGDFSAVRGAIEESARTPQLEIAISKVTRIGDKLRIAFSTGRGVRTVLYAVIADDTDQSSVDRGENAGRRLEHVAVARSLTRVADLDGSGVVRETELQLPVGTDERPMRLILFTRDVKTGHIVGVEERGL